MPANLDTSFTRGFNPEKSVREKRKLRQKLQSENSDKYRNVCHDENGMHLATKLNLCDCLQVDCSGCFMPCKKCGGGKCGKVCRNLRKFIYESIEYRVCATTEKRFHPFVEMEMGASNSK